MELEPSKKKEKTFDEHGAGSSRMHEDSNASGIVTRDHLLNFPVPNEGGKACIVKVSAASVNYFIKKILL